MLVDLKSHQTVSNKSAMSSAIPNLTIGPVDVRSVRNVHGTLLADMILGYFNDITASL